jgi:ATP-dependent RNA helicase RhlE
MLHGRIDEDFEDQFGVIHSNKSQNYRLSTMASFQEGNLRGLITTDIMARGLDISNITMSLTLKCRRCQNYTCTVLVERVVLILEKQLVLLLQREEEAKVEIEVLMNMELPIEHSLKRWKFQSNEPEKERQVVKFLMKRKR